MGVSWAMTSMALGANLLRWAMLFACCAALPGNLRAQAVDAGTTAAPSISSVSNLGPEWFTVSWSTPPPPTYTGTLDPGYTLGGYTYSYYVYISTMPANGDGTFPADAISELNFNEVSGNSWTFDSFLDDAALVPGAA